MCLLRIIFLIFYSSVIFICYSQKFAEANIQIDLSSLLSGVNFSSKNVSFNFKNLEVHNGKVEFDQLIINGKSGMEQKEKRNIDTNSIIEEEPEFNYTPPSQPLPITSQLFENDSLKYFEYPELVATIDDNIDPCNDFYDHVCQRWIDSNEIADDETSVGHMDLLGYRVHSQIQEILEENYTSSTTREQKMVHQFYEKCKQHKKSPDNKAFAVLIKQLRNARLRTNTSILTSFMMELRPMNFLVDVSVGINEFNSSLRILQIMPSSATLGYNAYTKKEYRHEYLALRSFLGELLDLLQLDDSDGVVFSGKADEYEARIAAFFEVDRKLAMISQHNLYNKTTSMVNYSSISSMVTNIDWKTYFASFVPPDIIELIENSQVQIVDEEGLLEIDHYLSSLNETTLKYYIDWQAVMYFGEFFDGRYQEVMQGYNVAISGARTSSEEKDCMSTTSNIFYDIVAQIYVQKYFPNQTKSEVNAMVQNIIQSFEEMLETNTWMDKITNTQALEKLHAISKFIGFNDQIFNKTYISDKYDQLNFTSNDTYYSNMLKIQQWTQTVILKRLNSTRTINEFEFPSTDVNAFYDPTSNSIALTAAILQTPYFNTTLPKSINYGAIGVAIGHEITHGFDSSGADYDKLGNRKNWWDDNTMATFINRAKCFIDQYSNITVEGTNLTIDGRLTLNENIADNGGIRAAILALEKLPNFENERIRGLEKKTPMQLFFMANAYVWCSKIRPQTVLSRLYSDVHSLEKWRINTVFSNQPEFAKAFNCPVGSKMNPTDKCNVW